VILVAFVKTVGAHRRLKTSLIAKPAQWFAPKAPKRDLEEELELENASMTAS
jgi:hypothetical protein